MLPLLTDRLTIRELDEADAPFLLELLNDHGFITYIADRGVRTLDGALAYLRNGPQAMIAQHGYGLWRVALTDSDEPVGICGILKRDSLPDPDLGYAMLTRHCGHGYAYESASATLTYAREQLGIERILAITALENPASIRLLGKLGFHFVEIRQLPGIASPSRVFSNQSLGGKTF